MQEEELVIPSRSFPRSLLVCSLHEVGNMSAHELRAGDLEIEVVVLKDSWGICFLLERYLTEIIGNSRWTLCLAFFLVWLLSFRLIYF
jgi:hypothetical protein